MTSEDRKEDATVEELAASAKFSHEDVAEVPAEIVEEEEIVDTNALSDDDVVAIDKFGSLGESDRIEKVQKMLDSGRKDQQDKAKVLMDAFDLEIEKETKVSETDDQVVESLKKMGLTPEDIKELKEERELKNRKESVDVWAKTLGIDSKNILKNKEFVKAYHSTDGNTAERVDKAMKTYLKENPIQSASKKLATLKLSTTGIGGNQDQKPKEEGINDLDSLLDGKSLDEIDISKL